MKFWKQFFTPVTSINAAEAKEMIAAEGLENITLLDVRQPQEYQVTHIPGATLAPMGELYKTMADLDPDKLIVVYCAIGGRSRVAAQMLEEEGFTKIYNLSGGIRKWKSETAIGAPDLGLELFTSIDNAEQAIVIGYGLEYGLREFYLQMEKKVSSEKAKKLFIMLADIEVLHQEQLIELYQKISGETVTADFFESKLIAPAMEGGLTTEQYLEMFEPDLESEIDILSLAMSIESQALDLYQRAANQSDKKDVAEALHQIATEERAHIAQLANYIDEM